MPRQGLTGASFLPTLSQDAGEVKPVCTCSLFPRRCARHGWGKDMYRIIFNFVFSASVLSQHN